MSEAAAGHVADRRPWAAKSEAPFIRIDGLTKAFGDVVAVDGVSLDIYRGEIFCLLGGSGCGKSTLLRMLAGFETPTAGRLTIDGADMTGVPAYARPTNMMFQSYALFPHMTVARNVAYGLHRDGLARAEIDRRVAEMLALVKLDGLAARKPHQLSGGQRQRVALARALVKRPKVLLLDEPLGALDKKLREETQFELIRIQESLGVTFIVVTHDQEEAMTLATRIGVMDAGEIVQVGEPADIYEYPASRFVADFVGSVNLFEAVVEEDEADHITLRSAELDRPIFVGHGASCVEGQAMTYAIRPEKIRLGRERPVRPVPAPVPTTLPAVVAPPARPQGLRRRVADLIAKPAQDPAAPPPKPAATPAPEPLPNAFQGVVEDIAYRGDLSIFRVRLPSGRRVLATRPNAHRWEEDAIRWDETVWIHWDDTAGVVLAQ